LIVEGLIGLYTDRENPVGDPQELVSMVDGALERDPQNKSLWNSRAIMFDRMKNYPESIKSFQKVVELDPQNVQATYNLALSYIFQGDAMNDEMNSRDYKSNADFQADQKKVIEAYKPAVPVLEAAHKLDPKHLGVLETLKSLTFRLRDEEGMMAKYEQYNKALNELKAQ
jgi:tetratricopeptide (TPR) repeat protein